MRVLEIAPPWVRTDLLNSREAEEAMPLDQFIAEAIAALGTDADEIIVEGARAFCANASPNEHDLVDGFNTSISGHFAAAQING